MNRFFAYAFGIGLGLTALNAEPISATTWVSEEFVCPIGGEKFKADVVASNSTFGQRPDGKPYSPLPVYPVVECPENGMLLFDEEFSEEELETLRAAIASDKFKAMRESDTQHYRVWWLKEKIGRSLTSQISSLLQASWETDQDPDRKVRYQADLVNLIMKLDRESDPESWFWFNLRAINALRELGYFSEALDRIDLIMKPEHVPTDPKQAENAAFFAGELRKLLDQQNAYREPANLVPTDVAIFRCVVPETPLTEVELSACETDAIQTQIADYSFKPDGGKRLNGEAAIRAAMQEWRSEHHQ